MKPMLAATLERLEAVVFPVYVSPKLDGIRCLIQDGVAVSRNLKPIPNKFIQECLTNLPNGLDGELMVEGDFNNVQSAVMSPDGKPNFTYWIFDIIDNAPYKDRIASIWYNQQIENTPRCKPLERVEVFNLKALKALEITYVIKGFEGIMLRSPESPYKFGRSGVKEGYLLKFKRFKDSEAQVIGFEEKLHNNNEKTKDALGHSKRSSHKANLIPTGTLGSLCMYDSKLNIEFNIGTGFNDEQRLEIWQNQKKYIGQDVTYTYQDVSSKGVPRFPSFKGFRLENK